MPAKFRTKEYYSNSIYHIYNKGLDGKTIFADEQDYGYFERLLQGYLTGKMGEEREGFKQRTVKANLAAEVELLAYCLMPDHVHLLIWQKRKDGITKFVRRVMTGYVMYFNKRYARRGPLMETAYRAVRVEDHEKALHLTRLIHLNPVVRIVRRFGPVETVTSTPVEEYLHSSYKHYIGINKLNWINNIRFSVDEFKYKSWVDDPKIDSETIVGELKID